MKTEMKTDVNTIVKTSTTPAARLSTTVARLRRVAALGLVAPVVALAACSGDPAVTADLTAPAATTPAATTTAPSETTTSEVPTTTTTTAPGRVTATKIKAVIEDPELGHRITATGVTRNIPWPSGNPVASEEYEIVGVWVVLNAGSRYSASLEPAMLSLVTADPKQTIQATTEFANLYKSTQLKPAERSKKTVGWVFFKVDRGTSSALSLAYNRPAYEVSTTDKSIKAKTFTVPLTK
jgi:hypothetical protein